MLYSSRLNFTNLQKRKKGNTNEKKGEKGGTEKACKIKQYPSCSLPEFPRYTKVKVRTKYISSERHCTTSSASIKRGCQHPSNKFEILWQVAQNSFSLLLSYFVAQYVLIIVE